MPGPPGSSEAMLVPLLVKGDRIRLKDGTRLFHGEGFDSESEPGTL